MVSEAGVSQFENSLTSWLSPNQILLMLLHAFRLLPFLSNRHMLTMEKSNCWDSWSTFFCSCLLAFKSMKENTLESWLTSRSFSGFHWNLDTIKIYSYCSTDHFEKKFGKVYTSSFCLCWLCHLGSWEQRFNSGETKPDFVQCLSALSNCL
jgi:hypothetical protein